MQIVVGTYERFLLGFSLPSELQEGCALQRSFTHAAHQGPVRCLDAAGSFVVSGGQDDQLHIYDVKHNKDLGFMMNPGDGAIPCLQFYTPPNALNPSHLFSGSDDGSIAIWKAGGGWEHLKLMRGHKGPVRSLSVHPTGKLALSVGHDRALRMWNLAKGRCSYTAKLEQEADHIAFNGSGEAYALLCDKLVTLHAAREEGPVTARLQHSRRACCLLQSADGGAVLSGLDDGRLVLWDVRAADGPVLEVEKAHNSRLRAITAVTPDAAGGIPFNIATASSDGVVKLWDSRALSSSSRAPQQLAAVSTNGRITGMVLSAPDRRAPAPAAAVGAGGAAAAAADGAQVPASKKKKQKQRKQLPQPPPPGSDDDLEGAVQQQQPQAKQQQAKQQQQQAKKPKMQQLMKKKPKQQSQPAGDDSALVPRVQTRIMKKKIKSKEEMQRSVAAVGGPRPKGLKQQLGKKGKSK